MKEETINDLETELKEDVDGKEIVNRDVVVEERLDGLYIKLIYEVIENIGVEEKLVF